jgi:hypothetical protein
MLYSYLLKTINLNLSIKEHAPKKNVDLKRGFALCLWTIEENALKEGLKINQITKNNGH